MNRYEVGQKASSSKIISDDDVREFAHLSGDDNPIHLDDAYAKETRFGKRIVHGILVSSLLSKVIGMQLPGQGTIYLSQELKFLKPVYIGQKITAEVEIVEIDKQKNRMKLDTKAYNEEHECVLSGEAKVIPPVE